MHIARDVEEKLVEPDEMIITPRTSPTSSVFGVSIRAPLSTILYRFSEKLQESSLLRSSRVNHHFCTRGVSFAGGIDSRRIRERYSDILKGEWKNALPLFRGSDLTVRDLVICEDKPLGIGRARLPRRRIGKSRSALGWYPEDR